MQPRILKTCVSYLVPDTSLKSKDVFGITKTVQASVKIELKIWSGPLPSPSLQFDYRLTVDPSVSDYLSYSVSGGL
jgi:hypothetical protein